MKDSFLSLGMIKLIIRIQAPKKKQHQPLLGFKTSRKIKTEKIDSTFPKSRSPNKPGPLL